MQQYNCFEYKPVKNKKIENFLRETKKELDNFFKINSPLPRVFLIKSRQDFDKYWGKKSAKWEVGWSNSNLIFILHPKIYHLESIHASERFWKTLKHEFCHYYYGQLNRQGRPDWLDEGLAYYLSGQIPQQKLSTQDKFRVLELFTTRREDSNKYRIGFFWTKLLLERYGKNKLLNLIKKSTQVTNLSQFQILFYNIYKVKFTHQGLSQLLVDAKMK